MARAVGIDLGTDRCAVSVFTGGADGFGGAPVAVPGAGGSRTTPAVVAFTADGEVLVGEAARRQAVTNAARTVDGIRRRLGTDWTLRIDGETYTAQRIAALLLGRLKADAEAHLGEPVTDAVITVPADFGEAQRQATREAGALAGLHVLRVLSEPAAVALANGVARSGGDDTVLVFRLGGGSFDACLLETGRADGRLVAEVKAGAGDCGLGGAEWDRALADGLAARFREAHGVDLDGDEATARRLREAAERAKTDLSSATETTVSLPFVAGAPGGPLHLEERLTRAEFEQLTRGLLGRCAAVFHGVARDSGIPLRDIDHVVLAGGATRMPALVELVRELTGGLEPGRAAYGDEGAAGGAAIQAAVLKGLCRDALLLDATCKSLGVETEGGVMTPVVERNTTIPAKRTVLFDRTGSGPLVIRVHQGEHAVAAENELLGTVELAGPPPGRRRGAPRIEVTVEIDGNGLIDVWAQYAGKGPRARMAATGPAPSGGGAELVAVDPGTGADGSRRTAPGAGSPRVESAAEEAGLGGHTASYDTSVAAAPMAAGAIAAALGMRSLAARAAGRGRTQLHFFEHGLVVAEADGATAACRWDALSVCQNVVRHFYNGAHTHTTHAYRLARPDGSVLLPGRVAPGADRWGPALQEAVTAAQLPRALAEVREGRAVAFGAFSLSREAMSARERSASWDRVEEVSVAGGRVRVQLKGQRRAMARARVSEIPNFFVFQTLAEHLRKSAGEP
ncbi:DUF6585 family protein [Streptomyces sp. NPDC051183]|uniref:DUF6585 family protein n=1 Tax=Streptomyces sp. NPDC051183 TaxID=3155165 RepID=UPI00342B63C0